MSTRFLTEHPLQVAPKLLGAELSSPLSRTAAFVLDFAVLRSVRQGRERS